MSHVHAWCMCNCELTATRHEHVHDAFFRVPIYFMPSKT